ncbi:glycine--tRNA ligase [Candidatus Kaiserbacteria bacterium RIFCSPHIGHO2_01_FULL_56_24]|uniref:glycine--tRNA ligase n=1 Tax=Candidatus Kaiserbacteria bacterium RIFCSPHIGHO2_01_FULL_56_24 TaxID=1798487 RepID=A0A1F6DAY8_9BACT|nr:MAG: glycine--tRNA ligase [Candidatus Kaiserbacteria bacterium RIFCSPHIGHO2_01_FULL_56_24]
MSDVTMEKIVSLCKRRGFIFPGSEIYGGLAGTWDYGPMGVALKNNIKNLWWRMFVDDRDDMYGMDAAILMNPKAWEASGHVSGFSDPMVECSKCKRRFRAVQLEDTTKCPECTGKLGEARQFNMMFKTHVGASEDASSITYLRPETAGGMFVNFKNVMDSIHPKMPFGLGQIGKAFRNEIAPRDFVFRSREFEQMEVEYFVHPRDWEAKFEEWRARMHEWMQAVGIDMSKVSELEVAPEDRAHYSKRTIDFEFEFPFGKKELYGLAYRTDFDLKAHAAHSGVDLSVQEEGAENYVPHVIEPSLGVDRTILAVLASAYHEDDMGGETRVYLKFDPKIAPVRAAVFPLLKNKPALVEKARDVYLSLKKEIPNVMWDDNGNIGKRYRRQDEIGTPYCITIDFDTLGESGEDTKDTVTLRDRDTGEQERVAIAELSERIR